jgi:Response regulator receiver domain
MELCKVLVVDDNPIIRLVAVDIVRRAGYGAVEAHQADEAMQILEAESDMQLVFTDIHMSGSDGWAHTGAPYWASLADNPSHHHIGQGSSPLRRDSCRRTVSTETLYGTAGLRFGRPTRRLTPFEGASQ